MDLKTGDTRLIIDVCKSCGVLRNQAAYILATAYHETAHTMRPVREYGGETYLKTKKYYPYVGMGYVQLTWLTNYKNASDKLGVDFVKEPRLLLKPEFAARILVLGMVQGWFAGDKKGRHTLARHITLSASDYVSARRIINGTDKAALIAGYAKQYDALLRAEGYGAASSPAPAKPVAPTVAKHWLVVIIEAVKEWLGKK